jgi:[amino group carrier protein]-L-2-aminoadipate 6-kinase
MLVIKIGGTEGINFFQICSDIAALINQGNEIIVVHGGSSETNELANQLGYPPRFITSPSGFTSRYTDQSTLKIFMMAVNGKINSLLVEQLQKYKINAFGLSGLDGQTISATRKATVQSVENGKKKIIRDDYTGKIERVNTSILNSLLQLHFVPVLAPLAISPDGEAVNIDADRAAASVAGAMKADTLILLTGAPGLLRKFPDPNSLIENLPRQKIREALDYAEGRMKKKILASEEAINAGVGKVIIADGRVDEPIINALSGKRTLIE